MLCDPCICHIPSSSNRGIWGSLWRTPCLLQWRRQGRCWHLRCRCHCHTYDALVRFPPQRCCSGAYCRRPGCLYILLRVVQRNLCTICACTLGKIHILHIACTACPCNPGILIRPSILPGGSCCTSSSRCHCPHCRWAQNHIC